MLNIGILGLSIVGLIRLIEVIVQSLVVSKFAAVSNPSA